MPVTIGARAATPVTGAAPVDPMARATLAWLASAMALIGAMWPRKLLGPVWMASRRRLHRALPRRWSSSAAPVVLCRAGGTWKFAYRASQEPRTRQSATRAAKVAHRRGKARQSPRQRSLHRADRVWTGVGNEQIGRVSAHRHAQEGGGHARAAKQSKVRERGSITVWLLGLAVLVLFVGGLSLDLWRAFSARQLMANAADAAAIAGATGIDTARFRDTGQLALDPPVAMQRAGDSLAHQGGLPLTTQPGVEVTPDPPQVVVVLTGQVRFTLLRVLLPNQAPLTIRVRAASVPREIP